MATQTITTHPFEAAGLGVAPFTFDSCYEDRGPHRWTDTNGLTITVGAPGQPMGTCQYCGQGIAIICVIRDANGKTFKVGSDCVNKTYAKGSAIDRAVRSALNTRARERRNAQRLAEPATDKQLTLIAKLGFEPFRAITKIEAGQVIDKLLHA